MKISDLENVNLELYGFSIPVLGDSRNFGIHVNHRNRQQLHLGLKMDLAEVRLPLEVRGILSS